MNVNFKLVWFENEQPAYEAHLDKIQSVIEQFHLIPDIQRYRCDEFDLNIVEEADLILADFDLGTDNSINIINNSFRNREIFIDALLYSSKYTKMVEEIKKVNPLMEGIFCAKRGSEDLYEKLHSLIFRIVRRAQTVENLRGIVMEYSSVFDKNIYDLIKKFCLNKEIFAVVGKYIETKINDSKKDRVFKSCNKASENCSSKCATFKGISSAVKKCCYQPENLIDIDDLLMSEDLYNKSRILDCILKHLVKKKILDDTYKSFHKNFYSDIIIYRNALAHQNSTDKKLYIREKEEFVEVDQSMFNQIKDSIKEYIDLFDSLLEILEDDENDVEIDKKELALV